MQARLGAPKAITATAHKLARIIYHLLKSGQPYDDSSFARNEAAHQKRREAALRKHARNLGFALIPLPASEGVSSKASRFARNSPRVPDERKRERGKKKDGMTSR
jgi:hypothetical protein